MFHPKYDATRQDGQVLGSSMTIVFTKEEKREKFLFSSS